VGKRGTKKTTPACVTTTIKSMKKTQTKQPELQNLCPLCVKRNTLCVSNKGLRKISSTHRDHGWSRAADALPVGLWAPGAACQPSLPLSPLHHPNCCIRWASASKKHGAGGTSPSIHPTRVGAEPPAPHLLGHGTTPASPPVSLSSRQTDQETQK